MATKQQLEDENDDLRGALEDAQNEMHKYRDQAKGLAERLRIAADILAHHGHLIDTPQAKLRWIEKGDGLVWRR